MRKNNIIILSTVLVCMILSSVLLICSLEYCKTIEDAKVIIKIMLPVITISTLLITTGVMVILSTDNKKNKKSSFLDKGKELFGIIGEYNLNELKKRDLKKEEKFTEIIKIDKKIVEELEKYLEEKKSTIYTIEKEHIICGVYVFLSENDEINNVKTIYTKEVPKEIIGKYDDLLIKNYKDLVTYGDYRRITVQNKVIEKDPTKSSLELTAMSIVGFLVGLIVGYIILEDIVFAIFWAIILGPVFSGIKVVIHNKDD